MLRFVKKLWQMFRADFFPKVLSVIALALGIGPGWLVFWRPVQVEYDPTIAVLTATLIALIWTAYYTYGVVQRSEFEFGNREDARARARFALLASISAELEHVKNALDVVASLIPSVSAAAWLATPQLSQALTRTDLLKPEESHRLTALSNALRAIASSHELVNAQASGMSAAKLLDAKERNKENCEKAKPMIDGYIHYVESQFNLANLPPPSILS